MRRFGGNLRMLLATMSFTAVMSTRCSPALLKIFCLSTSLFFLYFLLNFIITFHSQQQVSQTSFTIPAVEKPDVATINKGLTTIQHSETIADDRNLPLVLAKPRVPKVFIALKSGSSDSGASRLSLIIDTWLRDVHENLQQHSSEPLVVPLHVISDNANNADYITAMKALRAIKSNKTCASTNDSWLTEMFPSYNWNAAIRFVRAPCADSHEQNALCCKTQYELRAFYNFCTKTKTKTCVMDWFCHFDDDNYVNIYALAAALARHSHQPQTQLLYVGKRSTSKVYEISSFIRKPGFWEFFKRSEVIATRFGTGGAGYCLTNSLMQLAKPYLWDFAKYCSQSGVADDVALAYVIAAVTKHKAQGQIGLVEEPNMHSHLEPLSKLNETTLRNAISVSFLLANANDEKLFTQNERDYYAQRIVNVSFMGTHAAQFCRDSTRFHTLYRLYHSP